MNFVTKYHFEKWSPDMVHVPRAPHEIDQDLIKCRKRINTLGVFFPEKFTVYDKIISNCID